MPITTGASVSTAVPSDSFRIASAAASINASQVKQAPGRGFKIFGQNAKAAIVWLKIYDQVAAPNPAADVPEITIPLAASAVFDLELAPQGFAFQTGIALLFTTGAGDTVSTALAAGDILGFTFTYS
jgi:hypothetical protein